MSCILTALWRKCNRLMAYVGVWRVNARSPRESGAYNYLEFSVCVGYYLDTRRDRRVSVFFSTVAFVHSCL